ncbi:MAG: class I SAM-dependent methyltransferase, partial [Chloroflexota bacterium]
MPANDRHVQLALEIVAALFDAKADPVGVRLWEGTLWPDGTSRPTTLVLNHPGALRAMFLPGTELALGEAYLYNDFDIVGPIEPVSGLSERLLQRAAGLGERLGLAQRLLRLPTQRQSRATERGPAALEG